MGKNTMKERYRNPEKEVERCIQEKANRERETDRETARQPYTRVS